MDIHDKVYNRAMELEAKKQARSEAAKKAAATRKRNKEIRENIAGVGVRAVVPAHAKPFRVELLGSVSHTTLVTLNAGHPLGR